MPDLKPRDNPLWTDATLSLQAKGSRERAPDARLREAIQDQPETLDRFVAVAPRNAERREDSNDV
jgi:hypothetical protein